MINRRIEFLTNKKFIPRSESLFMTIRCHDWIQIDPNGNIDEDFNESVEVKIVIKVASHLIDTTAQVELERVNLERRVYR